MGTAFIVIGVVFFMIVLLFCGSLDARNRKISNLESDIAVFQKTYEEKCNQAVELRRQLDDMKWKYDAIFPSCQYRIPDSQKKSFKSEAALLNSVKNHMAIAIGHLVVRELGDPKVVYSDNESTIYEYRAGE